MISHLYDENHRTTKAPKKTWKAPLSFRAIKIRFSHLFPLKAGDPINVDTTAPVKTWVTEKSHEKIATDALAQLIGRVFFLKYGTPVNRTHITQHLNRLTKKPVQIRSLGRIVSDAVNSLLKKWSVEKPERKPRDTWKEDPSFRGMSFRPESQLGENETPTRETIIFSENSPEYITNDARGRISHLKWTAPNKAKGTEEQIRAKVFTAMRWKYSTEEVDDDMLRSCIIAAWDQLSGSGSHYVCSKKIEQAAWGGTKPINLLNKK